MKPEINKTRFYTQIPFSKTVNEVATIRCIKVGIFFLKHLVFQYCQRKNYLLQSEKVTYQEIITPEGVLHSKLSVL
jgi:hypothetical protein